MQQLPAHRTSVLYHIAHNLPCCGVVGVTFICLTLGLGVELFFSTWQQINGGSYDDCDTTERNINKHPGYNGPDVQCIAYYPGNDYSKKSVSEKRIAIKSLSRVVLLDER